MKHSANSLDINAIRRDFPILSRKVYGKTLIYLDNSATSQKPRVVIDAITEYYETYNSNVHRGVHALSMEATEQFENARNKISRFINAKCPEEIVWTRGATEAINLVAGTWAKDNLKTGDEIVLTEMEHHSNLVPWQQVAMQTGAILKFIPINSDGSLDLSDIDSIIGSRTKLLAVVHVSNSLGTINPIKDLTKKAKNVGASVLIDGAQSVPHMPVDVQDIDCDFLAFSGHKMLGPLGIGGLYAKRHKLEQMQPYMTGGEMVLEVWLDRAKWNDLPMKFEAGTPSIADAIGLGAAIDYLNKIGMSNIRQHEIQITDYALSRLEAIEELQVYGVKDANKRGGVVSFSVAGLHPHDLGTFLDRQGIALRTGHHCTMPIMRILGVPATARASFYLYNTIKEVDALVDGIQNGLKYFGH